MTAGHETDKPYYGDDGDDRHDGMDPLMAAILDAPLSGEFRADPAYMAGHRAATADLAVLREQLGVIADALTEPAPEPRAGSAPVREAAEGFAPVRRRSGAPRRRFLPLAVRAVAVAAAGAMVAGAGWLVVQVGEGLGGMGSAKGSDTSAADSSASQGSEGAGAEERAEASAAAGDSPLGDPGYLACARLVVEGDVTRVVPVPGTGQERVTLRITHSYRPGQLAAAEVDVLLGEDVDPLVAEGDHVLVGQAQGSASPDVWAVGAADIAAERAAIERALPRTDGVGCE
ncbi:hypothetical protein [Streptomyces sp. NPDC002328]|uniref:hypothetical protein n=1 Tax=Streptomyces sp. NPDC002328 TaxID=3364642 RepID=UPI00368B6370